MNSAESIISLQKAVIKRDGKVLLEDFDLEVNRGDSWWICGANGTGKTTLLEILAGKQRIAAGEMNLPDNMSAARFFSSVFFINRDFSLYRWFKKSAGFYQQRFFSLGAEDTPLVIDFISGETGIPIKNIRSAAREFGFEYLLQKRIVSVSTGEGRRIMLLILWLTDRKIICMDDVFEGLDTEGKQLISNVLTSLSERGVTLLLTGVETRPPVFCNHVLYIENHRAAYRGDSEGFTSREMNSVNHANRVSIRRLVPETMNRSFSIMAEMKNITIQYGDNIIQRNFSWKIGRGDKWLLTGPNGSGKSTLMSLIYGDNPMAYVYEMVVFDRKRGSGESIWEIKNLIGYFSSELQHFFPRSFTLNEAVLTGYGNQLVIPKNLTPDHFQQADEIIAAAGLSEFKMAPLYRLSFSQCRLALVCRALVKLPPVVILDEPCQGLDRKTTRIVHSLVNTVCRDETDTLIHVTHDANDVPEVINSRLNLEKYKRD